MIGNALPDGLARELCARLGTPFPSTWDDVAALYRAWCAQIPFDTIAKSIALRDGEVPPGANGHEVVERWLATGVGSACWGHCTAFTGVLEAAGVECRIAVDRAIRADGVIDFHSFVTVETGDSSETTSHPWVFDHVHATSEPIPLRPGTAGRQGPYAAGFRRDAGRLVHWFNNPERPTADEHYVVLSTDVDLGGVEAFCAISRQYSGVRPGRLYARRFPDDGYVQARPSDDGCSIEVRHWSGDDRRVEHHRDPDAALAALGYATGALALVERAGMFTIVSGAVRWSR